MADPLTFFKKRREEPEIPPQFDISGELPPLPDFGAPPIGEMRAKGMQPREIVRDLTAKGYPSTDIATGMEMSSQSPAFYPSSAPMGMPSPPTPPPRPTPIRIPIEDIERVSEAIISEKWKDVAKDIDDVKKWRDETDMTLSNLSDRMTKLEMKLESVEQAILGKVEEYGKSITDVGTELKAMQRVFQTVMPTFTENIKDLRDLVDTAKLKGFKATKRKH
jgi:hypothetical protein